MYGRFVPDDLEVLESVSRDGPARALLLRMAGLARTGRVGPLLDALIGDHGLDPETAAALAELAVDSDFLLAFEQYLRETALLH